MNKLVLFVMFGMLVAAVSAAPQRREEEPTTEPGPEEGQAPEEGATTPDYGIWPPLDSDSSYSWSWSGPNIWQYYQKQKVQLEEDAEVKIDILDRLAILTNIANAWSSSSESSLSDSAWQPAKREEDEPKPEDQPEDENNSQLPEDEQQVEDEFYSFSTYDGPSIELLESVKSDFDEIVYLALESSSSSSSSEELIPVDGEDQQTQPEKREEAAEEPKEEEPQEEEPEENSEDLPPYYPDSTISLSWSQSDFEHDAILEQQKIVVLQEMDQELKDFIWQAELSSEVFSSYGSSSSDDQ